MALERVNNSVEILSAYVPAIVRRRLASDPEPPRAPSEQWLRAAFLFADISGFSRLTETLESQGVEGAERVKEMLDGAFIPLIELVTEYGGEVTTFAGDALFAMWPEGDTEDGAETVLVALTCAEAIQQQLGDITVPSSQTTPEPSVRLRIAIAEGPLRTATLGGTERRWEFLMSGPPLEQLARVQGQALAGDIVVSREAWDLVKDRAEGVTLGSGAVRLKGLAQEKARVSETPQSLHMRAEAALRAYVPRSLCARIDAGQQHWAAEFRRVTAVFLRIIGIENGRQMPLELMQDVTTEIQAAIYRYGGSINQFIVDDKGTIVLAGWGLSLHTHEDDAVRALRATQQALVALRQRGVSCSAGISTGQVFVGAVGNAARMGYAVVGTTINLAARLAQYSDHEFSSDAETRRLARHKIAFEPRSAIVVKGREAPLAVFSVSGERAELSARGPVVIGRRQQRQLLGDALETLDQTATGGLYVIEGEAGIGKSRLVQELIEQTQAFSVRSLLLRGDAVDSATPYRAWREALQQLLGLRDRAGPEARQRRLSDLLGEEAADRAALLNPVLGSPLPESTRVAWMSEQGRADATRDLVVRIVRKATQDVPLLLVLEDAHWIDSASHQVCAALFASHPKLLALCVTRPDAGPPRSGTGPTPLFRHPTAQRLRIGALSQTEATALIRHKLDADSVPEVVLRLIWDKARGHPLFTEQLTVALVDQGLIEVHGGICSLKVDRGQLDDLALPTTVHGVITERLDRLTPEQQLTLKAASVIGLEFPLDWVRAVHPLNPANETLSSQVSGMVELGLLHSSPDKRGYYRFNHAITREVAYQQLLFAQRRELHERAGDWLEAKITDSSAADLALLAHHYTLAEHPEKAPSYLGLAGNAALHSGAFREARFLFERALSAPQGSRAATTSERARWERALGQALFGLGQMKAAQQHLGQALALNGLPTPKSKFGRAVVIVLLVLQQVFAFLLSPLRRLASTRGNGRDWIEGARASYWLGAASFHAQDRQTLFYAGLRSLDCAERAEPGPELARGYSFLMYVSGVVGLRRAAARYEQRAIETARAVEDRLALADVLYNSAGYHMTIGSLAVAPPRVDQALELYEALDERNGWRYAASLKAYLYYHAGDLNAAEQWYERCRVAAEAADDARNFSGTTALLAALQMRRGRVGQALQLLGDFPSSAEAAAVVIRQGVSALARVHQGEGVLAERLADEGLKLFEPAQVFTAAHAYEGYSAIAWTYLSLLSRAAPASKPALLAKADRACRALQRFARGSPIARPSAYLALGLRAWLTGNPGRAKALWIKSLQAAHARRMPFDEAHAHYLLGQCAALPQPESSGHLTRANELSQLLGVQEIESLTLPRLLKV